jgi:hypothetical protein
MDKITRQKIILTPSDKLLSGKINEDAEHVHILIDTTNGPFTITLPDANGTMKRELIFKNIGTTFDAEIVPIVGQYIDFSRSHPLAPLDLVSIWSDLNGTWWLLDSNAGNVSGSLTKDKLTKALSATEITDSMLSENANGVLIPTSKSHQFSDIGEIYDDGTDLYMEGF